MTRVIYKYNLSLARTEFDFPTGSQIIKVDEQPNESGNLQVWVLQPTIHTSMTKYKFKLITTGEEFNFQGYRFIDTVLLLDSTFVWHVFLETQQ